MSYLKLRKNFLSDFFILCLTHRMIPIYFSVQNLIWWAHLNQESAISLRISFQTAYPEKHQINCHQKFPPNSNCKGKKEINLSYKCHRKSRWSSWLLANSRCQRQGLFWQHDQEFANTELSTKRWVSEWVS